MNAYTYTSTSSEGTTATRNSKNATFAFAVWMANTDANLARNWALAGPRDTNLRCTNWFSSIKSAESIANRYRNDGFRVEIRPAKATTPYSTQPNTLRQWQPTSRHGV